MNLSLQATITCFDIRGVPCSELLLPSGTCSIGEQIVALTFTIVASTCDESRTSQDDNFVCQDLGSLPQQEGAIVVVSCQDLSGAELFNDTVPVGATVTVRDNGASGLPQAITCVIADDSAGSQIQTITFDTSGSVDLVLNDKFGMMELMSCDVLGQPLQSCMVPVVYTYELENIDALEVNVTSLIRTRNGEEADLTESIEPFNPLFPGDTVSTTETDEFNLCVDGLYETTIIAQATQLTGTFCEFAATYDIAINSQCRIDIDIDCTSQDGTSCSQLPLLDTECSDEVESVTFKYLSSPCGSNNLGNSSSCEDFNGGLVGGQIIVSCTGLDGVVIGTPSIVVNGGLFTIDLSGVSSSLLTCNLSSLSGTTLQIVTLDVSEGASLSLTDRIGGLVVDGCKDATGVELSCTMASAWTFEVTNIGSNNLNLTNIEIVRGSVTVDLSDQVGISMSPLDSINAYYEEILDRCTSLSTTTARVLGEVSGEILCSSEEVYEFESMSGTFAPSSSPITVSEPEPTMSPAPTPTSGGATSLPVPSVAPTQNPDVSTFSPTVSPTESTLTEPSLAPSQSTENSTDPPTETCLTVEIGCLPPFEGANCNDIPALTIECEEPPSEMVMRYNGGDCSGSFNIQPDTLFSCADFEDGPSLESGTVSYVTVSGVGENQEEYFAGFVAVGEDFTMIAQVEVAANINILIYDPAGSTNPDEIISSDGLLQNITMHTSCTDYLFLKDRFGAVQLVEFANQRQGRVTSLQTITLTYTISLPDGVDETVNLTGLTVTSNIEVSEGETQDLSQAVVGNFVAGNKTVTVEEQYQIDLTQRKRYTTSAVVVGQADDGKLCSGKDNYQFTAGNPLPPIFPTVSPSSPPTITAFPTPDPFNSTCEVEATITCALTNGRRCNLQSPAGSTCIGSDASLLQFMYAPESLCNGNNTSTNFLCDDLNPDVGRPQDVFIRIGRGDEDRWFSDIVSTGQVIDVPIPVGEAIRIEISTVDAGGPGVTLQESRMSVACTPESALTLLSYFGNLQLVGYQNLELGLQQVFANIAITYTAANGGNLDMELFGAFGSSPFTGFQEFLGPESQTLSRDESASFVEEFTLNLAATTGSEFQFTFLAQARGSISQVGCDDTAAFTLTIQ